MSEFQKWWDETYGQILTITNDPDADASCRIAKITALDAWMAGRAALEAERDALRADGSRYRWLKAQYLAADFDWQGESALVFKLPRDAAVSADCDWTIDAAIAADGAKS